jgi:adenylosuccinate lyase
MYADGASRLAGDQWEEGDVSCSIIRRVIIPDAFYVSDGLCETVLTVLNEMGVYPIIIDKEVDRYLPFMATTEILNLAVSRGIGREAGHKILKTVAVSEALMMRNQGITENRMAEILASDPIFKEHAISEEDIKIIIKDKDHFIGNARNQINSVIAKTLPVIMRYPVEAAYEPQEIL